MLNSLEFIIKPSKISGDFNSLEKYIGEIRRYPKISQFEMNKNNQNDKTTINLNN